MSIQVPGQRGPTSNPLVVLNSHLDQITKTLHGISDQMAANGLAEHHRAGVAPKTDGTWGVFCIACSARHSEFVYPCQLDPQGDGWPPAVLMEIPSSPETGGSKETR